MYVAGDALLDWLTAQQLHAGMVERVGRLFAHRSRSAGEEGCEALGQPIRVGMFGLARGQLAEMLDRIPVDSWLLPGIALFASMSSSEPCCWLRR